MHVTTIISNGAITAPITIDTSFLSTADSKSIGTEQKPPDSNHSYNNKTMSRINQKKNETSVATAILNVNCITELQLKYPECKLYKILAFYQA